MNLQLLVNSAPVIKESGGDFDGVIGGTLVTSDWLEIRVESEAGTSFLDKMIALVEGAKEVKHQMKLHFLHY